MTDLVSTHRSAYTPEETTRLLQKRLGDAVLGTTVEYGLFTVDLSPESYADAALVCRDESLLAFDLFDSLFGVDAGEDGFHIITILYSTTKGARIALRCLATGGREKPVAPSLTGVYPGADWMERETWDMFGVEFEGHPGLAPRILTTENFEGWPLRKDFHLASRAAKPWPGVKEPAELDEDGNVIEREPRIGDAPGPTALDKVMAEQAQAANPLPEPEPEPEPEATVEDDVDAATEKAAVEESVEDATSDAKQKAEEKRKAQAEARAKKAAERADAANVTTPAEDVPPSIPKAAAASPTAGTQGGPPAEGPATEAGSNAQAPDGTVDGGISETVDRDRADGDLDGDAAAPVEPEGRDVDDQAADDDQEGEA